jgi:hypothetical protein
MSNSTVPVRYQSERFALRWDQNGLTEAKAKAVMDRLESTYKFYAETIKFPEPFCSSATKYKVDVFVDESLSSPFGGSTGDGFPFIRVSAFSAENTHTLDHELTHVFQSKIGGMQLTPYTRWFWESHANWMASQVPGSRSDVDCSVDLVNYPHLYYGSVRTRYCNWQFWEFLKDKYGYGVINDIWTKAPKIGEPGQTTATPLGVLMRNQGWPMAQLDDMFGEWAMHNVTWDYVNPDGSDQGAVYRAAYGNYARQFVDADRFLRTTQLDPIDLANRRFAVPFAQAPQRFGYNVVQIVPDAGSTQVSVSFRGVRQAATATTTLYGLPNEPSTVPEPASGWRWGLVAVDAAGKPRYSTLKNGEDDSATIALQAGDTGVYMVVVAAPTQMYAIMDDQPYYALYRYPYMVQVTGGMPWGYQPNAPDPTEGGHRHPNGGGWVAAYTKVAASAYVGPNAVVLMGEMKDNARLEDHAVLLGATVAGNGAIGGLSIVGGASTVSGDARVDTSFRPLGAYGNLLFLSGTAQLIGDVSQRDVAESVGTQPFTASRGLFFGRLLTSDATDRNKGAELSPPLREITAKPNYVWR